MLTFFNRTARAKSINKLKTFLLLLSLLVLVFYYYNYNFIITMIVFSYTPAIMIHLFYVKVMKISYQPSENCSTSTNLTPSVCEFTTLNNSSCSMFHLYSPISPENYIIAYIIFTRSV